MPKSLSLPARAPVAAPTAMPEEGDEEEQAEEKAPQGAAGGAGAGQAGALVQLHLAVRVLGDPGDVLELDQEFLLHPLERGRGLGSRVLSGYAMTARVLIT